MDQMATDSGSQDAVTVRITKDNLGSVCAGPASAIPAQVRPRESGEDPVARDCGRVGRYNARRRNARIA
jgi:hypothetical protein